MDVRFPNSDPQPFEYKTKNQYVPFCAEFRCQIDGENNDRITDLIISGIRSGFAALDDAIKEDFQLTH